MASKRGKSDDDIILGGDGDDKLKGGDDRVTGFTPGAGADDVMF